MTVNLYGGPGAGKTTAAWEIAAELKKEGILTEYVPEYAKELVWQERFDLLDGTREHQAMLIKEQARRINVLQGKVSVVVTDSPILLGLYYLKEPSVDISEIAFERYSRHNNLDIYVRRLDFYGFEQAGRIHTPKQCASIDVEIQTFLKSHNIPYLEYNRDESYKAAMTISRLINTQKQNKNHQKNR